MKKVFLTLFTVSFFALSCSTPTKSDAKKSGFQLRPFQEETLNNGLHLIWIQDASLPRISLNMMVNVGAIDEEKGQQGLNALTVALLDQGTAKRSAMQLAEELDQIGTDFNQSAGSDYTTLTSTGLAPTRAKLLSLFSEIILKPAFQAAEVNRRKAQTIAAIQKNQDQPSNFADELLDRAIFGAHPYSSPVMGTVKSIASFQRTDLVRHYFAFYRPNNSILSVVGQFDEDFKGRVRDAFANWQAAEVKRAVHVKASLVPVRTVLVHKPGLQQTQIRMGHLGIARSNPDFMALRLGNVVLGGAFASRLNQRVRDDLGLTYSIHSASDTRLEPGSFEISTFTRHEKMADTILETQKVFHDFLISGVSDQELDAAKALMNGQFPAALETPDRLAYNLMVLRRYGVSDDYLRNFQVDVRKITKTQVNEATRRNMRPESLQTVIYSDQKAVSSQLGRLGSVDQVPVTVE